MTALSRPERHGARFRNMADEENKGSVLTKVETRTRIKRPRMYRILLHNDDFTPREFVVRVLEVVFGISEAEATKLMIYVHNNGVGVVGIYPYAVAETKVAEVLEAAEKARFPLMCTMEPESDGDEES